MSTTTEASSELSSLRPVLEGIGLVKTYGRVVALDGADFALYPGEDRKSVV